MNVLSEERPSQAISVLLVEDDAPTLWRLQDALTRAGFQVTAAGTLAEARAHLAADGPKVLLTDLQLPDGHGVDLIRETRQRFPETEIMVISILGDEESVISAITVGATGYLLKDKRVGALARGSQYASVKRATMNKTVVLGAALLLAGCLSSLDHGGGGGGGNGGTGGSGGTVGTGTMTCGQQTFPISTTKVAPNIMMVVDESGSMKELIGGSTMSKWTALVGAVNQLLNAYSGAAQWGLSIFPHTPADTCSAGQVDVAVGSGTVQTILSKLNALNDTNIGGNTPTQQTLQAMLGSAAGLADASRANYVLLMTDGQPNCGGDAASVATTVAALYAQTPSVRTFVVGIGDGTSSNPAALNSWADAGHTARTGVTRYYQVNTVNDLNQAFADIVSGVASCEYQLSMKPADASLIVAYVNGQPVVQDPANGTTYDAGSNTLVFHGSSCDTIKNGGATKVDIVYGCPPAPVA